MDIIGYLNRYIVRKDMQIALEKEFESIDCQSLSKEKQWKAGDDLLLIKIL